MTLKNNFTLICIDYETRFLKQMGFDSETTEVYWVSEPGSILAINDYFFSFEDIRLIVDEKIQEDKVFEWYDYCLENSSKINLKSYISGARDKFKVYLSAPISGRPLMEAMLDFIQSKTLVMDAGHTPVSPLDEINYDKDWIDNMEIEIERQSHCDKIWFFSPIPDDNEVRINKAIAKSFGIPEFKLP